MEIGLSEMGSFFESQMLNVLVYWATNFNHEIHKGFWATKKQVLFFTMKTSKHVGLGGPWFIEPYILPPFNYPILPCNSWQF